MPPNNSPIDFVLAYPNATTNSKNPKLAEIKEGRLWDVWDEPPELAPGLTLLFRIVFPTSKLTVYPAQRSPGDWKNVVFFEGAPPGSGKMVVVSLFITDGEMQPISDSEASLWLASLDIGENKRAQLVVHGEPEAEIPDIINRTVAEIHASAARAAISLPPGTFGYFWGQSPQGWRYYLPARYTRPTQSD